MIGELFSSYLSRRVAEILTSPSQWQPRPDPFVPSRRGSRDYRSALRPPAALFDNAAPLKSRRGAPCRFQGGRIPRRSVVLAPAYHAGHGAVNLSDAKPQRSTLACVRAERRTAERTPSDGHSRGPLLIASTSLRTDRGVAAGYSRFARFATRAAARR